MVKILHFSPVRKPAAVLDLHLNSLRNLDCVGIDITFSFFDDNIERMSSHILQEFVDSMPNAFLHEFQNLNSSDYRGRKRWVPELYHRITHIKNEAIKYFLKNNYDYLFFSDSDLMVHPRTVVNLVAQRKHFCSTIFWTHFEGSITHTPNAWYSKPQGFSVEDLFLLRESKILPVDYTGACTLVSEKLLRDGVSFSRIHNIFYLGEDKHFCIRAAVLGYQAYVNTEYPAFHIYNENLVAQGQRLLENGFDNSYLVEWLNEDWEAKIKKWLNPAKKSFLEKLISKIRK